MDSQINPNTITIDQTQTVSFKLEGLPAGASVDNTAIYWNEQSERWCNFNVPLEQDGTYHTPVLEVSLKDEYQAAGGDHVIVLLAMYAPSGVGQSDAITHAFGFKFYEP